MQDVRLVCYASSTNLALLVLLNRSSELLNSKTRAPEAGVGGLVGGFERGHGGSAKIDVMLFDV